jgi:DNA primase
MDSAGVKAAKRGIDMALGEEMNVSVIRVPDGKDPAECVKNDPQVWRDAAARPIKVMDFYFESVMAQYDAGDVEGKKRIAQELLGEIRKLANKIEQSYYIQRLGAEIGIEESVLVGVLEEGRGREREQRPMARREEKPAGQKSDRTYKLQENLVGFIVLNPGSFGSVFAGLEELFEDEDYLHIYEEIKRCYEAGKALKEEDLEHIKRKLGGVPSQSGSQNLSSLFDTAVFSVEFQMEEEGSNTLREAEKCILNLREVVVRKKLKKIEMDIKEADRSQDAARLQTLLREQIRLLGELK